MFMVYLELNCWVLLMLGMCEIWLSICELMMLLSVLWLIEVLFDCRVIIIRKFVLVLVIIMFCWVILVGRCGVVSDILFCICIWVMFGLVLVLKVRVIEVWLLEVEDELKYSRWLILVSCCLIIWVIDFLVVLVLVLG